MSKVLVVGGTGQVGSQVAKILIVRGFEVSILVRPASIKKASDLVSLGATLVLGDLLEPAILKNVVDGVDFIVATAAAMDDTMNPGYQELINLSSAARVKQFVFVSNRSEDGDQMIPMLAAKTAIHHMLRDSNLNFTILKFDAFVGTMMWIASMYQPDFPVYADEGVSPEDFGKHYWITEQRVAEVTAACVGNILTYNKTIQVGGPEAYSLLEFAKRNGIPAVMESQARPEDHFFYVLKNIQEYDSPKPDDLTQFEIY